MPHVHTQPGQHDHTISAVIIRLDFDEPKVMLHRHRRYNQYMQFGGHVELDESPWKAIKHEILEESGYDFSQLEILQPKSRIKSMEDNHVHPVPLSYSTHRLKSKDHYHIDVCFAFVTDQPPANPVVEGESEDIIIISLKEAQNLGDILPASKDLIKYIYAECLPNWERVKTSEFTDY